MIEKYPPNLNKIDRSIITRESNPTSRTQSKNHATRLQSRMQESKISINDEDFLRQVRLHVKVEMFLDIDEMDW